MERLAKKLERERYNANKELAMTLYSILSNSRRRKDWLLIGFPTLLLLLLVTQNLEPRVVAVMTSLIFGAAWLTTLVTHWRDTKLLKRLTAVISEKPHADREYIDYIMLYVAIGALFIPALLQLLLH